MTKAAKLLGMSYQNFRYHFLKKHEDKAEKAAGEESQA